MSVRDQVDPQLLDGLETFLAAAGGVRGIAGIADPVERRAAFTRLMEQGAAGAVPDPRVTTKDMTVPGPVGAPDVPLRLYRPTEAVGVLPAIYYIHGGGMTIGSIDTEDAVTRMLCAGLGCAAVSVEYRLAPEHPHPAPVEDCYAGLAWTAGHAEELGIDADRLVIYGGSAGGGLAASTALLARDRGGPALACQMLIYPMLDDRGESGSCRQIRDLGVWDGWANIEGWEALLGERRGTGEVDGYAAAARAEDLRGLPPTWIDVGELDALRDEGVSYALRLMQAGVHTDLHVYAQAYHGFEVFAPEADVSKAAVAARIDALRRAFG